MQARRESRARFIGALMLLILGAFVLHSYLPFLLWSVVLAITTWPLYVRLLKAGRWHGRIKWIAVMLTLAIGAVILIPLGYGLNRLLHELQSLSQLLRDTPKEGIPAPAWLEQIPWIGAWAKSLWQDFFGDSEALAGTLHALSSASALGYTKAFVGQLMHRLLGFLITLLALFFVYLHGENLGWKILAISRNLFGETGVRYAEHALAAVRATVNGLLLVGLGEGLLLGVGYAVAGLNHPALLGALTGILAMIPFAAKLIFGACALVLITQGHAVAGTGLFIFGLIVILAADNYVRPVLIGGAVRLPFLWTLLGIFGGLENFGLLGLFLGPTLLAVLMSIWRDFIEDVKLDRAAGDGSGPS